jgi:putative DNA primase/helicase
VRGTDDGIWRRIHLLPFTVAIPADKVERDFRERRLMPELPGILNWALAGLAAYCKQGLNPPDRVLASTQEYREDMDIVGQWIAERCEVDPKASVPTGAAYSDYSEWAAEEVGWELKKPRFRRQLSDRGFAAVKGAHGQRMIKGLRLKPVGAPLTALPNEPGAGGLRNGNTFTGGHEHNTEKVIGALLDDGAEHSRERPQAMGGGGGGQGAIL